MRRRHHEVRRHCGRHCQRCKRGEALSHLICHVHLSDCLSFHNHARLHLLQTQAHSYCNAVEEDG